MLTKKQKADLVADIKEKFSRIKVAVFTDYSGLGVSKMTELRRALRAEKSELKVAKKTLAGLALKEAGVNGFDIKGLEGQIAFIFGYQDEVAPARILYNFGKTGEHLKILGGLLGQNILSAQDVINLAKLPAKQDLLAKAVGSIAAPLTGMVNVLQGNIRGLVQVLSQIKK